MGPHVPVCFQVLYHLNCENLCSDFQEDLRFRFSMGLVSMIQRFLGGGGRQSSVRRVATQTASDSVAANMSAIPRGLKASHSPVTPTNEFFVPQDDWSLVSKVAVASLTSQGTMGGLIVGGLLLKTVGWRVIIVTGAVYGALYGYERLTWTSQVRSNTPNLFYKGRSQISHMRNP